MIYQPNSRSVEILDRAMDLIREVPYQVSLRWVFYKLLGESYYSEKEDYTKWIKLSSRARHEGYGNWMPYTLADDTREIIERGTGFNGSPEEWLDITLEEIKDGDFYCSMDRTDYQDYYIELWFEARGMADQFKYYTEGITLVPMGGQPSIVYKWEIAKRLEDVADLHAEKEIIILYFGDLDLGGERIKWAVERDVRKWCWADFTFIDCGLNRSQIDEFNVIENPDRPGEYQWVALSDEGANSIIDEGLAPYWDQDANQQALDDEAEAEELLKERIARLFDSE